MYRFEIEICMNLSVGFVVQDVHWFSWWHRISDETEQGPRMSISLTTLQHMWRDVWRMWRDEWLLTAHSLVILGRLWTRKTVKTMVPASCTLPQKRTCVFFGLHRQDSLLPPYMCSGCSRKQRVTVWSCSVTELLRINSVLQQAWVARSFNLQPYNEETINITTNHIINNKLYIYNYDLTLLCYL